MTRRSNFLKFFNSKAKPKRGLRKGSFTPLQVVRTKSSSTSSGVVKSKFAADIARSKKIPGICENQSDLMNFGQTPVTSDDQQLTEKSNRIKTVADLKSHLPGTKEPMIIAETQSSDDAIDSSQETKQSNNILENRSLRKVADLKPHLPGIKEPIIIAETQRSDDVINSSPEEKKTNILEDRSWNKSLIKSQNKLKIAPDTDLGSDLLMMVVDDEYSLDVIPYVHKKGCGVAAKANKSLGKNKDLGADEFKMNKPSIIRPTVLAHADTQVLYAIDDSLKESIVAKLNESKYKPEKKEAQKLAGMCVKMRHPVLPQHQVERTAGTRTMRSDEKVRFEKYATLKKGTFVTSEDEKIKENWKTFCQDNHWDPKKPEPFLLMKHYGNKQFLLYEVENRRNFVRCLAHGLPDRSLYSVNQRFRNLFGNSNKKDRYTAPEDRLIRQYLSDYPYLKEANESARQFANLAVILHRKRESVWRRFQLLEKKMKAF